MSNQLLNKPKGLEVKTFNDYIVIIKKWFSSVALILAINTLVFVYGSLPIVSYIPSNILNNEIGKNNLTDLFLQIIVFLILLLVLVILLYTTIAKWINRTYIIVTDKAITVDHKPLPCFFLNNKTIRVEKIENLFLNETEDIISNGTRNDFTYTLYAKTYNNTTKKLIKSNNKKEVLFIEKTLKDYLNIED